MRIKTKHKIVILCLAILVLLFFIFLHITLKHTSEVNQHNMGLIQIQNTVYLHPDGHKEAVYGPGGNLIESPENIGSFNFCNPIKKPICHFIIDTIPWIAFGNSPDDTTQTSERLTAFLHDFLDGFKTTWLN